MGSHRSFGQADRARYARRVFRQPGICCNGPAQNILGASAAGSAGYLDQTGKDIWEKVRFPDSRGVEIPTHSDPRNALPEPRTAHRPDLGAFPGREIPACRGDSLLPWRFSRDRQPEPSVFCMQPPSRPSTRGGVISPEGGCKANSIACGCECQNSGALCQCPDIRNCAEWVAQTSDPPR